MKRYPAIRRAATSKRIASLRGIVTDEGYVVEIKRSARRRSGTVGEWVNREGTRRRFESKALARAWARAASGPGATVWIQDAAPDDDRSVDGYLVGGQRAGGERATGETRQFDLARF